MSGLKRETIPDDPDQSLRFFSWAGDLTAVDLHDSAGGRRRIEGFGDRWHYHPEVEITLFTEGRGMRFIGDDISPFAGPELILIGSQLPHFWQTGSSAGCCIQLPAGAHSPLAALRESRSLIPFLDHARSGLRFDPETTAAAAGLLGQCAELPPLPRLGRVLELLHHLSTRPCETLSKTPPQVIRLIHQQSIQKAVKYLVDHADDDSLRLEDVLAHTRMSRATFSRHFRAALGTGFTEFLQRLRLERARQQLLHSKRPVTEIAYACGFGNLSHFNLLFRRRWGISPRELRRQA